ncbi:hypothetical protein [uncultured Sulfitobacter sp.]|nr:hypothetical protein [uncultured Sulfitobacter sp.]
MFRIGNARGGEDVKTTVHDIDAPRRVCTLIFAAGAVLRRSAGA